MFFSYYQCLPGPGVCPGGAPRPGQNSGPAPGGAAAPASFTGPGPGGAAAPANSSGPAGGGAAPRPPRHHSPQIFFTTH